MKTTDQKLTVLSICVKTTFTIYKTNKTGVTEKKLLPCMCKCQSAVKSVHGLILSALILLSFEVPEFEKQWSTL